MDVILLLVYAAPIALAALGETVSQKAGVLNIGLEGMMLLSAFAATFVAFTTHSPWLGLTAGVGTGILLALLSGWFAVNLAADQVVVGTAVNLLALGLTGTLYRAKFGQSGQLLSVPKLPSAGGVDPVLVFLILSVPLVWFLLQRTSWGLAIRSVGEYPKAAEASGFSVNRLRMSAICVGGLYAGLAGAYLSLGITGSFAENMTAGRGFVAIAMVTFGRWKPIWVFAAALLVGYVESLQYALQAGNSKLPYQFFVALPYLVALLVLVLVGKGTAAPMALGTAYRREK